VYDAVYLDKLTRHQLTERLADLLSMTTSQLEGVYTRGPPANVNVDVTDNVSSFHHQHHHHHRVACGRIAVSTSDLHAEVFLLHGNTLAEMSPVARHAGKRGQVGWPKTRKKITWNCPWGAPTSPV